jgi:hypothetical protein
VVAVIVCHDHQLKIAVVAIGACDPVRVHDLDATRFLARSRHVPSLRRVANFDNERWSLYGAPWLQPVATARKSPRRESREFEPKPLPSVATGCRLDRMVRRGSTVRVRQRALIQGNTCQSVSFGKRSGPCCGQASAGMGSPLMLAVRTSVR